MRCARILKITSSPEVPIQTESSRPGQEVPAETTRGISWVSRNTSSVGPKVLVHDRKSAQEILHVPSHFRIHFWSLTRSPSGAEPPQLSDLHGPEVPDLGSRTSGATL